MDKSEKPMTEETIEGLIKEVNRIKNAVELGKTPRLHNALERNVYRMYKEWRALGNGNIDIGYARWVEELNRRDERRKQENPVWRMLAGMYEAENPVKRTLAKIVGAKISVSEFKRLANETLAQEIEKSAQELPEASPIQPIPKRPWELSRPAKRQRDRIIWEMRNEDYIWDEIAKELSAKGRDAGITTIKENYERMKRLNQSGAKDRPLKNSKKPG